MTGPIEFPEIVFVQRREKYTKKTITKSTHGYSTHGAKHFPPGGRILKSEGPPVAGVGPSENQDSDGQIESKRNIFDSCPHDFPRRFRLCLPHVLNPSADVVQPYSF